MLVVVAIGVVASLMAHSGLGMPARMFFFAGVLGSPLITFAVASVVCDGLLLVWTLAPCFRRVVDFYVGFYSTSIMLATPSFMGPLFHAESGIQVVVCSCGSEVAGHWLPLLFRSLLRFVCQFRNVMRGCLVPSRRLIRAGVRSSDDFYFLTLSQCIAEAE